MDTADTRIPVTLLTGFLGAGKTTLLNQLIRNPDAGRIAVIMNEFGSIGVDHDLIEASTEETILMQSGCLCCTFRGDISRTLGSLMARLKRGDLLFDRVVIETTGIADPAPILHTFVVDDLIASYYRIDGVVNLADAATGEQTLQKHSEAVSQIAMADLVVVTKSDLVSSDEIAAFDTQLEGINAGAKKVRAEHGHVPIDTLFGLSAMRENVSPEDVTMWIGKTVATSAMSPNLASRPQLHPDHQITSASIALEEPISASAFDDWLEMLLAFNGPDILRIKGIVHVEDLEFPLVFHGVQHIFDAPVPLTSWTGKDEKSRVVVIARNVIKDDLQDSLELLRMRNEQVDGVLNNLVAETAERPF